MSSSVDVDNKKNDILIFGKGSTLNTTLTTKEKYPINFTQSGQRYVLGLHCNGCISFSIVNTTKLYHFKAKNSEIKDYALCLGNISKDFTINNMKKKKKKNRIKRSCKCFFWLYRNRSNRYRIYTNDILDIHKYLMKRTWYKIMFGLIKKIFIGLLTGLVNGSNLAKWISLSN